MYKTGDLVVYGSFGVCRLENVVMGENIGGEAGKEYFCIKPVFDDCSISVPTDTKVFMRKVIEKGEAQQLIGEITVNHSEAFFASSVQQLADHYDKAIKTHECSVILDMLLSIYEKRQLVLQKKQKFGQLDERFMKKAEDLLFNEFSFALDMTRKDVEEMIKTKAGF